MSVFSNIFKIKELKSRIFFTLGLVFICRMISIVPTPGVDAKAITDFIRNITEETGGGFMGMFDVFNGGALSNCSVGMLSIWPYISASIIIQLMTERHISGLMKIVYLSLVRTVLPRLMVSSLASSQAEVGITGLDQTSPPVQYLQKVTTPLVQEQLLTEPQSLLRLLRAVWPPAKA